MAGQFGAMIAFDPPGGRFWMRAGGFLRVGARYLVSRKASESWWYLPGGRIEFGETGQEALSREFIEEIGAAPLRAAPWGTLENFFRLDGRSHHELNLWLKVEMPDLWLSQHQGAAFSRSEGETRLHFAWARIGAREWDGMPIKPDLLADESILSDPGPWHRAWRD